MTTPGFNGAVNRTYWPMPLPPAPGQSSAQGNGGGQPAQQAHRAQRAQSTGASRQNAVRSAPSMNKLIKPILFMLLANVLFLAAVLACVTLILIPVGVIAGIQSFRFGWRGLQMLFER